MSIFCALIIRVILFPLDGTNDYESYRFMCHESECCHKAVSTAESQGSKVFFYGRNAAYMNCPSGKMPVFNVGCDKGISWCQSMEKGVQGIGTENITMPTGGGMMPGMNPVKVPSKVLQPAQ